MPRILKSTQNHPHARIMTAGIDVGGERKGFHAVALLNGAYHSQFSTKDAKMLSQWCRDTIQAQVVAVDAPSQWSREGRPRPAERMLMQNGIRCFSTPTREQAVNHRSNYFGWMLKGMELFEALAEEFPVCLNLPTTGQRCSFETFPHAITWHLRGGNAKASKKEEQRRALLHQAGISLTELTQMDLVDAALCALTAHHAAMAKECSCYGDSDTGWIIVPMNVKEP